MFERLEFYSLIMLKGSVGQHKVSNIPFGKTDKEQTSLQVWKTLKVYLQN